MKYAILMYIHTHYYMHCKCVKEEWERCKVGQPSFGEEQTEE